MSQMGPRRSRGVPKEVSSDAPGSLKRSQGIREGTHNTLGVSGPLGRLMCKKHCICEHSVSQRTFSSTSAQLHIRNKNHYVSQKIEKVISFYIEHVLLVLGMITLYFEILRSTRNSLHTVIDHSLSTLVFIGFFTQFLLVPSGGNFTFLLLTLMSLLDVVAGFTISISNTRNAQFVTPSELPR